MVSLIKKIINFIAQFNNDGRASKKKSRLPSPVPSPENIDGITVALQRSPKEGCSTTRDIQTIGATNVEKLFEFISIQNGNVD
jgi:hypothetical protein